MSLLNINRLLQFSVQLEEKGEEFYRDWAEKSGTEEMKKFFTQLSRDEDEHKKTFSKLAIKYKDPELGMELSDQYLKYFEEFLNDVIFNPSDFQIIKNFKDAVEIAKKQELDAILFYTDIRNHLASDHVEVIDRIIDEERDHFTQLSELSKNIT